MKMPAAMFLTVCGCVHPAGAGDGPAVTLTLDVDHPATVLASLAASETRECSLDWEATSPLNATFSGTSVLIPGGATAVWGVPVDAAFSARARCVNAGGETIEGEGISITTGSMPSSVPGLVPLLETPVIDEEYILTSAVKLPDGAAISIGTVGGEPVWWETLEYGHIATHTHYDPLSQLVFAVETSVEALESNFVRAGASGPTERWAVPNAHHDSLDLGGGRYLLSVTEERTVDGELIAGDDLVIFDVSDASQTVVWRAFDELEIVANDGWNLRIADGAADWTHINGLAQDAETGKIYASLYYDRSIVQIDPDSWATDWVLGGPNSEFVVTPAFGPQHSPVRAGTSLWMFDNGADVEAGSRLVEYTIDDSAMTADEVWSWQPQTRPFNVVLGSIALADDATIGSWGDSGEVRIIDPGGTTVGYYDIDGGLQIGFTSFIEGL